MSPTRAVRELYRTAPAKVRAHVRARWATCPLPAVAAAVPAEGRVLEVGCGHGLLSNYLALESPRRQVEGVDVDAGKIDQARAASARAPGTGASFTRCDPGVLPDGPWQAVVVVDVLYLLDEEDQRALLGASAAGLAPGGVLVVKEMSPTPRWKAAWNRAQETLAVRVLAITAGSGSFCFLPPEQLCRWMQDDGLEVDSRPLHRGYLHPHHLLVGRRPAGGITRGEA